MIQFIIPAMLILIILLPVAVGRYLKYRNKRDMEAAEREYHVIVNAIEEAENYMHLNSCRMAIIMFDKRYSWLDNCAEMVFKMEESYNARLLIILRLEERRRHPLKAV